MARPASKFILALAAGLALPAAASAQNYDYLSRSDGISISGGDANLVRSLGAFCDARSRDDVSSFFAAHPLPGAARTLTQTIEQINNCIALREKQTPAVAAWLEAR